MVNKIYIAGPMRGIPEWNHPAFEAATQRWREVGWQVFSPHNLDKAFGYEPEKSESDPMLRHVITSDVLCLTHADAIALLPGWENSKGAAVELALAQFLMLFVYDAVTMKRIYPAVCPWSPEPPPQPISTAPRDGSTILADCGFVRYLDQKQWGSPVAHGKWAQCDPAGDIFSDVDEGSYLCEPKTWTPVPDWVANSN